MVTVEQRPSLTVRLLARSEFSVSRCEGLLPMVGHDIFAAMPGWRNGRRYGLKIR